MAKKKMPVDVGELIAELTNLDGSRNANVSVSMYIDDTAPADVIAYTRNAFASASANARLSIAYLINSDFIINEEDDFAVIVAGRDSRVGARAEEIRAKGVPVMVVTTAPQMVKKIASEAGHPLPDLDVVCPEVIGFKDSRAAEFIAVLPSLAQSGEEAAGAGSGEAAAGASAGFGADVAAEGIYEDAHDASGAGGAVGAAATSASGAASAADASDISATSSNAQATSANSQIQVSKAAAGAKSKLGAVAARAQIVASKVKQSVTAASTNNTNTNPYVVEVPPEENDTAPLTKDAKDMLSARMGKWVISTCKEKGLAMAISFPFVRKPFSNDIVNVTAVQNAGVGVVFIIPGADMPVMTLNQCKMILQIAAAYGQDMTLERAKELAAIVAGGFACRGAARQVLSFVPIAGWAVKGTIGYTGTLAMGRAAIEYFENGSGISGLTGLGSKIRESVQQVIAMAQGKDAQNEDEPTTAEKIQKAAIFTKQAAAGVVTTAAPVAKSAGKFAASCFSAGVASMAANASRK